MPGKPIATAYVRIEMTSGWRADENSKDRSIATLLRKVVSMVSPANQDKADKPTEPFPGEA